MNRYNWISYLRRLTIFLSPLLFAWPGFAQVVSDITIVDSHHYSHILGETRHYRVFLPPSYFNQNDKHFPVIYFFHGWSQRYFGSSNPYGDFDQGEDNNGDNIAKYVINHDVIVVKADGYNRSPDEPYYVRPYNVTPVETYRQFPEYFPELVQHIDLQFRTVPDRQHRGISGLSMGGFMTFWVAGKYPHLVSAAGSFCGSPEFTVGPRDFPVEYRHLDMHGNYAGINARLHFGDKDFIRGYHRDLNRVWPELIDNYSWKVFDAAHSTCGLGEMFDYILDTFRNPPPVPTRWNHTDVYPSFSVWGYQVVTDRIIPGFTVLEDVDDRGFRCAVREFVPDGETLRSATVTIRTSPVYKPDAAYIITDFDVAASSYSSRNVRSNSDGSLTIRLDGGLHEIGINREIDRPNLVVADYKLSQGWANAGRKISLDLGIVNKGLTPANHVSVRVEGIRSTTIIDKQPTRLREVRPDTPARSNFTFHVSADSIRVSRLKVTMSGPEGEWTDYVDVPLFPDRKRFEDIIIADGKSFTVAKSGNDTATVFLGNGNGDGVANPGESIVILVRDGNKLWRTQLSGTDPYVNPFGANKRESDNWAFFDHVGGSAKYHIPLISSHCPPNRKIELFAEYWLPDQPLHIERQGIVSFTVRGSDTTPPVLNRIDLAGDNVLQVYVRDGGNVTRAIATLTDEKDSGRVVTVTLNDDGKDGDRAANDRVFSGTVPPQKFGIFRARIEAEDEFGNRGTHESERSFVLH